MVLGSKRKKQLPKRTPAGVSYKMNVLVTGGVGYVGSIVSEELIKSGYQVVILDNLQQGHKEAIAKGASLVVGDIRNNQDLDLVFKGNKIDAVMHMAAETVVEFSMTDPQRYFHNNITGGISLLDAMLKHGVKKIIFSSSAATYGEPKEVPIVESHPQQPVNSYGETKLMFEKVLGWYGRAYGLQHISFRYFNAAGASEMLGEDHIPETHLIPIVVRATLNTQGPVSIFGDDYPTKDGSCVRDYVHVKDIAQAHQLALEKIGSLTGRAYNLGNGNGFSNFEVVEAVSRITGKKVPTKISPRRAGDPAVLVASSSKAKTELGWKPQFSDLDFIIRSAVQWHKAHPRGYASK
jgi:UDP-glucose 4-epimerase